MFTSTFHAQQKPFIEDCCRDVSEDSSAQMSPISPCKYPSLNLKLSQSSAETCEEDTSRKGSWQGQYSERNSIDISRFSLEQSVAEQGEQLCEQFHEQGYCFKGRKCDKIHMATKTFQQKQLKRAHVLNWILKETPELLLKEVEGFNF